MPPEAQPRAAIARLGLRPPLYTRTATGSEQLHLRVLMWGSVTAGLDSRHGLHSPRLAPRLPPPVLIAAHSELADALPAPGIAAYRRCRGSKNAFPGFRWRENRPEMNERAPTSPR